jgi:hypothetical protein
MIPVAGCGLWCNWTAHAIRHFINNYIYIDPERSDKEESFTGL